MALAYERDRERMVAEQIEARGVRDERVLAVMRRIPRHVFVRPDLQERAYEDTPLPIGERQTISQPYMVALMSEVLAVQPGECILEVGTGSGYQTAVLAELGATILSLERLPGLAIEARRVLGALGYGDVVTVEVADGSNGWLPRAPYDAIVVTAAAPSIPRPLVQQLAAAGRLVLPMGEEELQTLVRLQRTSGGLSEEYFGECRFVKLVGNHGWEES